MLPSVIAAAMLDTNGISRAASTTATQDRGTSAPTSHGPGTWLIDHTCVNPGVSIFLESVTFDSKGGAWMVGAYVPSGQTNGQVVVFYEPKGGSGGCTTYTPYVDPTESALFGVAAVSPTEVWAVGVYGPYCGTLPSHPDAPEVPRAPNVCSGQPLALHYVNGSWYQVPVQHVGTSENDLYAVGVDTSNNVFASGLYFDDPNGSIKYGLIEKYDPNRQQFVDADPGARRNCAAGYPGGYQSITFSTSPNYVWVVGCGDLFNSQVPPQVLRWDYVSPNFEDTRVCVKRKGSHLIIENRAT
jgi:hypothetical protein